MNESKIDLTDRLRRESRWPEAAQFKDSHARKLRDGGMKRGEANQAAWEAVEFQFPPIEIPEPEVEEPASDFTPEQIAGLPPGSLKDFASDADWVYSHLEAADTNIEDAPSAGAVGLLIWARANKDSFYEKLMPKALSQLEKKPDTAEEAKQANLAHAKNLWERTHHLLDAPEVDKAIGELRAKKGFAHDDHLGFAGYLKQLAKE